MGNDNNVIQKGEYVSKKSINKKGGSKTQKMNQKKKKKEQNREKGLEKMKQMNQ